MRERLRTAITTVGTQRAWAELAGIKESIVSEVLNKTRKPPATMLEVLGLTKAYAEKAEPGA